MIQGVNTTPKRKLISSENTRVDREQAAGNPPADGVAQKVNLLPGVVLSPEANATEQEWPLVRLRGVGVAAGQLVVVPEHGSLKLEPLPQERQRLHLTLRLFPSLVVQRQRGNVLS